MPAKEICNFDVTTYCLNAQVQSGGHLILIHMQSTTCVDVFVVSPRAILHAKEPEFRPPSSPDFGFFGEMNSTSSTSSLSVSSLFLSGLRDCCRFIVGDQIKDIRILITLPPYQYIPKRRLKKRDSQQYLAHLWCVAAKLP